MIRTQIQLSETQMRALRELAAEKDESISELVRQGVDLLLLDSGVVDRRARLQQAANCAGRFRSGLPDLAVEHDRYLQEDILE
jgi:hypothetical protein